MNSTSPSGANHIVLSGQIIQKGELRYTPAGLPAIECELSHESQVTEAQQLRLVRCEVKCVALGVVAQQLQRCQLGQQVQVSGFLAPLSIRSKSLRLHIQVLEA